MGVVLVFGKYGRLATMLRYLQPTFVYLSHQECDVRQPEEVQSAFDRIRPAVIINCAGQTDVAACERDPASCRQVNTDAVRTISRLCIERDVYLIHISTDSAVNPINEYGRSKLNAEVEVGRAGVAVRVNFFTLHSFVLAHVSANTPMHAYVNVYFNPISVLSFGRFLDASVSEFLRSSRPPYEGVIAAGTKEKQSVYDFALLACEVFARKRALVSPVSYDGSGLPRNLDTYVEPVNALSSREDLEDFRDFLDEHANTDN